MSEKPPIFESTPDRVPTIEEVQSVLIELLQGKEFTVARKLEDENGLYMWDIRVVENDGTTSEYSYTRKGRYPEVQAQATAIHVNYLDAEENPLGGNLVAKYVNDKWESA